MIIRLAIFISIALFTNSICCGDGYLLIIGGGDRPDYMMRKFVDLAGGEKSNIIIVPMASGEPTETAEYQADQIKQFGAGSVTYIICDREEADNDAIVDKLENTTGIFFSGGNQNRLTEILLGTKLLERIKILYREGGVIAGTSAGAAVMSKIMITGDEILNDDSTNYFGYIQKGNIKVAEGFGFLENVIIDQHFVYRKRYNRLISLVLENPGLLGIGIDEETAILVYPDHSFETIGERQVMIFDATESKKIKTNDNNFLGASDIKIHILLHGDKFDINGKKMLK